MKNLLNYKTVLVLLFVIAINLVVAVLVWQLDFFVHGDLYSYGLVYSQDWANPYWYYTAMLWAFLGGATAIAVAAIVPHYLQSREEGRLFMWTGFFLPILALVYQGLCIFVLFQKTFIINSLNNYGVSFNSEWTTTYNLISQTSIALTIVAFMALIIPAVRALEYKLGIVRS